MAIISPAAYVKSFALIFGVYGLQVSGMRGRA